METADIKSRLAPIFCEVFSDNALVLTEGMPANDVTRRDSLSHIKMIYSVENASAVKFSIKDARSIKNVGDLIQLIQNKAG
jgi:acyl carrier protein